MLTNFSYTNKQVGAVEVIMTDTEKGERVERWIYLGFAAAHIIFSVRAEGVVTKGEWIILALLIIIAGRIRQRG